MKKDNSDFVVLEVKKSKAGKQIHMDSSCLLENAHGFKVGERMILNSRAGSVLAVRGKKGWSIDKQTCRRYTENLSKLIS